MVGGKPFNTEHKLNEYKHVKHVKQKKRGLGPDRSKAACKEAEDLMNAGTLRRVKNHTCVTNPVMAYVDDMVIKSISEEDMLKDIQENFDRFCSINMKLNLKNALLVSKKDTQGHTESQRKASSTQPIPIERCREVTSFLQGEVLVMYHAASAESISAALLARREERQVPIYFVSMVLQGAKLNYPALEKIILALVHAARRLQSSSKKQIPKDFSIKMPSEEEKIMARKMETKKENPKMANIWKLYTDGASSSDGSGAGLMLINPEGKEYTYALRFGFKPTNNEAKYKVLLAGLRIAQEMEIRNLAIFADSQLMVNQIKGLFEARQPATKQYLEKVPHRLATLSKKYMKGPADLTWNLAPWWSKFEVPRTISSKDDKKYKEGIFADFCKGLKITQSFSPITEHVEIMNHIEKQLVQS
ncbi:reverse transcriptase domain-containing protein [Tanacetum coccineum]